MSMDFGTTPRRERYEVSVFVYRWRMLHFSFWKSHGSTTTRSPSRIHIRFFSFPGIRPRRDFPSAHITRMRDAPRSWSATPKICPSFRWGIRTRISCPSEACSRRPGNAGAKKGPRYKGLFGTLRDLLREGVRGRDLRHREGDRSLLLERLVVHDPHALRRVVVDVLHVPEPVDDEAIPEQVHVRLELLPDVPPDLDGGAGRRLALDPELLRPVPFDRFSQERVRRLLVLPPEGLLRAVLDPPRVQPLEQLRLPPAAALVLLRAALRGVDDVRAGDLLQLPPELRVADLRRVRDVPPELLPRHLLLLKDHERGQCRRELQPPR